MLPSAFSMFLLFARPNYPPMFTPTILLFEVVPAPYTLPYQLSGASYYARLVSKATVE